MNINLELLASTFTDVEFFLACVFPETAPTFCGAPSSGLTVVNTPGFWAVTSTSAAGKGLVHEVGGSRILFRGYETGASVHSYSAPADLVRLADPGALENGVFAYLKFDPRHQQALLRSDPFGIAPLFCRQHGAGWLIASHPGLIRLAEDVPDLAAWASMIQNSHALADRTIYRAIERCAAGVQMTMRRDETKTERWFDFSALPPGNQTVDEDAAQVVEDAYLGAMARCLKLDVGDITLPFSSGFDSRRFFATLLRKKMSFTPVTCQTFHRKKGRDFDIDSFYAPKIAAAFGLKCEIVPASGLEQIGTDAARRQTLIGSETPMHGWAVPLMRWLARRPPSLVFDGLAGDAFGNSSFDIEGLYDVAADAPERIVNRACASAVLEQLSSLFPSADEFRRQYLPFVTQFTPNLNQSQLAFVQARTRRCISPWITMMHPPGHVVAFPYCDREFVQATLSYHPVEKFGHSFQKVCLQRFYPEFYDFHSTRNLPAGHPPLDESESRARDAATERFVYGNSLDMLGMLKYLNLRNKALLLLTALLPPLRRKRDWLYRPLLLLSRMQRTAPAFINVAAPAVRIAQAGVQDEEWCTPR